MPTVMQYRAGSRPITARLLDGERLWLATTDAEDVARHIGLYSHIRRHGKYLHIARTTHNGQAGIEMWADDDANALTERKTRLSEMGFQNI